MCGAVREAVQGLTNVLDHSFAPSSPSSTPLESLSLPNRYAHRLFPFKLKWSTSCALITTRQKLSDNSSFAGGWSWGGRGGGGKGGAGGVNVRWGRRPVVSFSRLYCAAHASDPVLR